MSLRRSLNELHHELRSFIDALLSDLPENEGVSVYFTERSQHSGAVRQDLLPLIVYVAISEQPHSIAIPLAAAWSLHLAAAHMADAVQDQGDVQQVHQIVLTQGAANIALAKLNVDQDTLRDALDAIGRVAALGAKAQEYERMYGRVWTRADYFRSIAGKAAAIIATGVWLGGRLATDNGQTLAALQEFGLALGMAIQISDDCLDLAEDLVNGTFTLPVIEALAMTEHPDHLTLKQLLAQQPMTADSAARVKQMLEGMGVLTTCQRIIRAYQIQAAAVFTIFPNLEPYFTSYVAAKPET